MSTDNIPEQIYIQDFRRLKVWQKSVELSDKVYEAVRGFPDFEKYAMANQVTRSVTSVSANLAEGNSQVYPKKEFSFANNALGSAGETKHWVEMAYRRGYISEVTYEELVEDTEEVIRIIIGYMKKLRKDINS